MSIDRKVIRYLSGSLSEETLLKIKKAAKWIIDAKEKGKKVVVMVGSGPNLHEGVTTLIAELMHKGIVDGVTTSSAVINHEMGGTLEKVKRISGAEFGFESSALPADGNLEVSIIPSSLLKKYKQIDEFDLKLYKRMLEAEGNTIIKVAGNIAYPTGLFTEMASYGILKMAKRNKLSFENVAGILADPHTMIGAGALKKLPVLVSVPQLVGGGQVGLSIGDSLPISKRSLTMAKMIGSADVIIESAIALTQEIHDGPFETFTGHGIWKKWDKEWTYSLKEKKLIRIDMDPNLENAWLRERKSKSVSRAVSKGLPKTKRLKIPFRMEMSGFARIPGSMPIIGDIGVCWPVLATIVADSLDIKLDFMCYKQSLTAGKEMREWIVKNIKPIEMGRIEKFRN